MKRIAVIGVGAVGVSVLSAMARNPYYQDCQITIYDQPQTFGTGLPYQSDSEILLINQTGDTMSLEPEDPFDFVKWVEQEKGIPNGEKGFFPRPWYGEYLLEKLNQARQILQPRAIYEEATSIRIKEDGTYLVQSASTTETYDCIHLSIGHLPYQDPYQLLGQDNYIHHPYPVQKKMAQISNGARVGVIGTGLTGIDLLRYFQHEEKDYHVHSFSRGGEFPLYRGFEPQMQLRFLNIETLKEAKAQHQGFVPLEKMVEWFRLECADKQVDFNDLRRRFGKGTKAQLEEQLRVEDEVGLLQAIIHKLDPHLADFLNALTEADRQKFFSEYEPLFKHFRAPMPKKSLEELLQWWNAGEIAVWQDMQSVESMDSGFRVSIQDGKTIEVDYLVNATGHNMQVKPSPYNSQLLNQLVDERILQAEPFGGVQVLWPSAQAISQRYGVLEGMRVHGQLVQGTQYGNNARLLMLQANQVVNACAEKEIEKEKATLFS